MIEKFNNKLKYWQVHHRLNMSAVSYDIKPTRSGNLKKKFIFPIRNDTLVILSFRQMKLKAGFFDEIEQLIDRTLMEQRCNDIIDSLNISLSDESQQAYPGAKRSEKMQALKWTTEEEDEKHAYYLSHRDEF